MVFVGDLDGMPWGIKKAVLLCNDLLLLPISLYLSLYLVTGDHSSGNNVSALIYFSLPLYSAVIFMKFGLYRAIVRYIGFKAFLSIGYAVTISAIVFYLVALAGTSFFEIKSIPVSAHIVYWLMSMVLVGGSRVIARQIMHMLLSDKEGHSKKGNNSVAIYGAGTTGVRLSRFLRSSGEYCQKVFFDEDLKITGREIDGIKVLFPSNLQWLCEQHGIKEVFLAIPNANSAKRKKILDDLSRCAVKVRTIPSFSELVAGKAQVEDLREVAVEDLLGRAPVAPKRELIEGCITGKTVLVTGAGGSIGSELCRQIVSLTPARLVLFERSEFALYQVEAELSNYIREHELDIDLVGLLGSVQHRRKMSKVMRAYRVDTVYHAAAYKHVPIVEHNPIEGVRNNIFGTFHTALAAKEANVETFVLVSTDKAVRPKNIMGATKRFAELVLQGLAQQKSNTKFCMVRFGNVLNSSGSVVPLFRKQIQNREPLTVTHPEVTRYFMTIPEAAQLVLQAGYIAKGGDVCVLDMGESVKIIDLAKKMIKLSGLSEKRDDTPEGDIEIKIVGLRPGEKLYEELLIGDNVSDTEHPLIMRAEEKMLSWEKVSDYLDQINAYCHDFNVEMVRSVLLDVVSGYEPQCGIQDQIWLAENAGCDDSSCSWNNNCIDKNNAEDKESIADHSSELNISGCTPA